MDDGHNLGSDSIMVPVTSRVTKARLFSLLCGALEGGSNYWIDTARIKTLPPGKERSDFEFWHLEVPLTEGGAIEIGESDGIDDTPDWHVLDLLAIEKGCRVMADNYPRHWHDFVTEGDDAITSDVFLQCCLFGGVIYG